MKKVFKPVNSKTVHCMFLLLSMLACTITPVRANSGISSTAMDAKIINGKQSQGEDWPWMVALLSTDRTGSVYNRQICGGTLVAPQWVLTAAHCVENSSNMEVLLGENNLQGSGGEIIKVTHFIIHPDRNLETKGADLALLHLETPSAIDPVVLANDFDFESYKGTTATAVGWGAAAQNILLGHSEYPVNLQQVNLTINDNPTCDSSYLPQNIICLGVYNQKTICDGDSGGPLLMFDSYKQEWKQVGITSLGYEICDYPGAVQIYTQVDKYKSFIDSTINGQAEETPEAFLARCVKKFPEYLGEKEGRAYLCGDSEICQRTTGGQLMDIRQISVLRDNRDEVLEFLDMESRQWHKISFSDLGYCE